MAASALSTSSADDDTKGSATERAQTASSGPVTSAKRSAVGGPSACEWDRDNYVYDAGTGAPAVMPVMALKQSRMTASAAP